VQYKSINRSTTRASYFAISGLNPVQFALYFEYAIHIRTNTARQRRFIDPRSLSVVLTLKIKRTEDED